MKTSVKPFNQLVFEILYNMYLSVYLRKWLFNLFFAWTITVLLAILYFILQHKNKFKKTMENLGGQFVCMQIV